MAISRGRCSSSRQYSRWARRDTQRCGLALLLVFVLSASAFLAPAAALVPLALVALVLVCHGMYRGGKIGGVLTLAAVQLTMTLSLYLLLHGMAQLSQGVVVVARIILATLPGWWLCVTVAPERIGEVLSGFLPSKWAFVVAASLSLLPYMTSEIKEIYQIQRLRGAKIAPRDLRHPKNWSELVYCVLFPVLIQLLKLSRQMAIAAQCRHFGRYQHPTHWHAPREEHE